MGTRNPAVAGMFYPAGPEELKEMVNEFMSKASPRKIKGGIRALIVPHAGYIYSGQVAAQAYSLLRTMKKKPTRVIVTGPSHYVGLRGVASDANQEWLTPLGRVKIAENPFPKNAEAHVQEHSVEVQVPFLQLALGDFSLVPLVAGEAEPAEEARILNEFLDDDTLLVVSSDLSHYHDYDTASRMDSATIEAIKSLDPERLLREGEACGIVPILILLELARMREWKAVFLDYKNSGDVSGDSSRVVGYASFAVVE